MYHNRKNYQTVVEQIKEVHTLVNSKNLKKYIYFECICKYYDESVSLFFSIVNNINNLEYF